MKSARWEHAELKRSRERGAWDRWGVQDAELRGEWLFFAFDQRRIYAPLEHPELPHHFANVANPNALTAFVQQYGRLGWHELIADDHGRWRSDPWAKRRTKQIRDLIRSEVMDAVYAEPLDWLYAHALTIQWCLAAALAVRRADVEKCRDLSARLPRPVGCRGTIRQEMFRERTLDKVAPVHFVGGMLEDYLWINLRGVRRRVLYSGGRFLSVWGGDSLLESIYTLVADAVSGGRLGHCESCGAVFIQTDERQRFCPPREGLTKSPCMNRERVQRYRRNIANGKKRGRHGKTTRTR